MLELSHFWKISLSLGWLLSWSFAQQKGKAYKGGAFTSALASYMCEHKICFECMCDNEFRMEL